MTQFTRFYKDVFLIWSTNIQNVLCPNEKIHLDFVYERTIMNVNHIKNRESVSFRWLCLCDLYYFFSLSIYDFTIKLSFFFLFFELFLSFFFVDYFPGRYIYLLGSAPLLPNSACGLNILQPPRHNHRRCYHHYCTYKLVRTGQ